MKAALRYIEKALRLFAAALFTTAIMVNFANIVGRYLFLSPIYWAEEVTIVLVIWAVFLIGFELTLRGEHLKMGLLSELLPKRFDRTLQAVIALIGGIIAIYVAYHSVAIVSMVIRYSQVTAVAQIPKWLLFGSVSTGFALIVLASFIRAVDLLLSRSGDNDGNGNKRGFEC